MAGTVVVDNITTGTGATVPAATVVSGTAKAWVNFNSEGTVAIRASFNVSSITDLAAGAYGVNFTNAMSDANYLVVSGVGRNAMGVDDNIQGAARISTPTTTSVKLGTINGTGSAFTDAVYVNVAVFR